MKIIQNARLFGRETCIRYELDKINHFGINSNLIACYLLATEKDLSFESLVIEIKSKSEKHYYDHEKFTKRFPSLFDFLNEYNLKCGSWHLQMWRNGYPISFGAHGDNSEVGCTYHHWCLLDVEKLMNQIENKANDHKLII